MSDGTLCVRRRDPKASEPSQGDEALLDVQTIISDLTIGHGSHVQKHHSKPISSSNDLRLESQNSKKLKEYDRLLKNFKYSAALDSVLKKVGVHHLFGRWLNSRITF